METKKPIVGILMGSDSDYELVASCLSVLKTYDIPFEVNVISAHRDTETCLKYAKESLSKGLKVIIAFAGLAAHLGGVIAANTTLPVIGVPLNRSNLGGLDALFSTVQMPPGIPVATVAIDGSANAAHLTARIIALQDAQVQIKLLEYQKVLKIEMGKKSKKVQERIKNEIFNG